MNCLTFFVGILTWLLSIIDVKLSNYVRAWTISCFVHRLKTTQILIKVMFHPVHSYSCFLTVNKHVFVKQTKLVFSYLVDEHLTSQNRIQAEQKDLYTFRSLASIGMNLELSFMPLLIVYNTHVFSIKLKYCLWSQSTTTQSVTIGLRLAWGPFEWRTKRSELKKWFRTRCPDADCNGIIKWGSSQYICIHFIFGFTY